MQGRYFKSGKILVIAIFLTIFVSLHVGVGTASNGRVGAAVGNENVRGEQRECPDNVCLYFPVIVQVDPPVQIVATTEMRSRFGTCRVTGEVLNIVSHPVYDLTLQANAYDENDNLVGTRTKTTAFPTTFPGAVNPFDIDTGINNDSDAAWRCDEVEIVSWRATNEVEYRPATVVDVHVETYYTGTRVDAEVRNDEAEPLKDVQLLVWSIYQSYSIIPWTVPELAPGETITFTTPLHGVYGNAVSTIEVAAQGVAGTQGKQQSGTNGIEPPARQGGQNASKVEGVNYIWFEISAHPSLKASKILTCPAHKGGLAIQPHSMYTSRLSSAMYGSVRCLSA